MKEQVKPDGELVEIDTEKYFAALRGVNFDVDSSLYKKPKVRIDSRGYSPDVAELLGREYLKNRIVIMDVGQKQAPLINPNYSFMGDFISKLYSEFDGLIQAIVPFDCIVGQLGVYLPKDDNINFGLSVNLESPNKSIERIREVQKRVAELDKEKLFEEKYVKNLADEVRNLNKTFKDVRKLKIGEKNDLKMQIESFEYKSSNCEAYFFGSPARFGVYFGEYDGPDTGVTMLNGAEKETLFSYLLEKGCIRVDRKIIEKEMKKLEAELLEKIGRSKTEIEELQNQTMKSNIWEYYNIIRENKDNLDGKWFKLNSLLKGRDEKDTDLLYELAEPSDPKYAALMDVQRKYLKKV